MNMLTFVKSAIFLFMLISSTIHTKEEEGYLKYVDEIVDSFVIDMKKKHNLHCYGSGGRMPTDVEKIDVLFISYSNPTLNDARKMEVSATQDLLHRIR